MTYEELKREKKFQEWYEKIRVQYRKMSKDELRVRLSREDDETLRWICSDIAMPTEDYEICQVAKDVLFGRGKNL